MTYVIYYNQINDICRKKDGLWRPVRLLQIGGEIVMMRIAVTYENGNVFQHFGHSSQFKIYDVEDGNIVKAEVVDTNGQGHGALVGFLQAQEVNAVIAGGIGGGAKQGLAEASIDLYGGVTGSADDAVIELLNGTLKFNPDVACSHHDHQHDHGEHHCGTHGCGGHQ